MSLSNTEVRSNTPASADVHDIAYGRASEAVLNLPQSTSFRMQVVLITPEVATHWLQANRSNRRLYTKRVKQYANDMETGKFFENGDTICFSKSHLLIDGQHRLHAVIASGVPLKCIVVVGIEDEAKISKDTGKSRSPKDILGIEGVEDWEAGVLGTALHTLVGYELGRSIFNTVKVTNHEIRDFYMEHSASLERSLRFVKELPRKNPEISHSRAYVLHVLFSEKDPALADEFMTSLFSGELLLRGDPVYFLRESLKASQINRKPRSSYDQWFACIKTWNLARQKKSISSARVLFPRREDTFPDIK